MKAVFADRPGLPLAPQRWTESVPAAWKRSARRRLLLSRLYELSGDIPVAPFRTTRSGAETRGSILWGRAAALNLNLILLSLAIGVIAAVLAAANHKASAMLTVSISGVAVAAAAMHSRGAVKASAQQFISDYPATLMAMGSSMKAGLTPLLALERAVRLLDAENELRLEVQKMTGALRRGISREAAIGQFGCRIDAPELELFRSAFLLVLENGGRFTPTLERLALVSRDRCSLIQSAAVSTQSMRMTANILLAFSPLLVAVVSFGSADYWSVLREHPAARLLAIAGAALIGLGYLALRAMSDFRP